MHDGSLPFGLVIKRLSEDGGCGVVHGVATYMQLSANAKGTVTWASSKVRASLMTAHQIRRKRAPVGASDKEWNQYREWRDKWYEYISMDSSYALQRNSKNA